MAQDARLERLQGQAPTRYEDDIFTWAGEQVSLLKQGRFAEIDADNIAEELSDVAKSEYRYLQSALAVLSQHLLKWDYQPERRSRSWVLTIREQRARVVEALQESPGLKGRLADAVATGYHYGRLRALDEMQAPDTLLPEVCPYVWTELLEKPVAMPDQPV